MVRDTAAIHAPNASSSLTSTPSRALFSSAARPPPLDSSAMGQAESTVRRPDLSASVQPQPSPQPTSKYRFGWPGRRKKSGDFTKLMDGPMASSGPSSPATPPHSSSFNNKNTERELGRRDSDVSSFEIHTGLHMHELSRPQSRSSARQLTLQFASNTLTALKGKLNASQASIHSHRSALASPTTPPPLPPKSDMSRLPSSASSNSGASSGDWISMERSKPLPAPATDSSAPIPRVETRPLEVVPTTTVHDVNPPQRRERERREGTDMQTAKDIADDWRKSDSTLRTVKLVGSRTPRPLSLAESTNSAHTVLPSPSGNMNLGAGKRLSALIMDVDFGLPEVDSEDDEEEEEDDKAAFQPAPPSAVNSVHNLQTHSSSPGSSRSSSPESTTGRSQPIHRRELLSTRVGRFSGSKGRVSEHGHMSGSDSEALSSSVSTRDTGLGMGLCTANSSTTSVSSSPGASMKESRTSVDISSSSNATSNQLINQYAHYESNAKLNPWVGLSSISQNASNSQVSLSTSESTSASSHAGSLSWQTETERTGVQKQQSKVNASPGPGLRPAHQRTRLQSIQARGFRQTAVNLANGLAPAAGFARKAVDRVGRALGGSAASLANSDLEETGASTGNGYGHSPSASASSMTHFGQNQPQPQQHHRSHPHQRQHLPAQHPPSSAKKAMRRHGANQSGTWSINSSSNSASLSDTDGGLAGPHLGRCIRAPILSINNGKGLVFGRELELCVKDTACQAEISGGTDGLELDGRILPALVVRCAQHIVKWGVQEEGLFRISGRSTHVSKLRAEFDSGADYDLRDCGPGEIDPHAVSSIFKAYLRELPEPLLTRHLMPYFEAALAAETNMIMAADAQNNNGESRSPPERVRGPGLPSNPRDSVQIRKAPSLSTFAVPTLSPRTASARLLSTVTALVARLPKVNRDLLRTVTELIAATARASRETKMPLSNLLLVFCPSLMMSPPLLRVLVEGMGIWDGPQESVQIPEELLSVATTIDERTIEKDSGSSSGEGGAALHPQRTIRRSPRTSNEHTRVKAETKEVSYETEATSAPTTTLPTLVLPGDASPTLNGKTSAASGHSKTDSSISSPLNLSSPSRLTASTNSPVSLDTPMSSNPGSLSPSVSTGPAGSVTKPGLDTTGLSNKFFTLRAQSDLPAPLSPSAAKKAVRKSLIGNPVPFPLGLGMGRSSSGNGSAGSAPVTPIEHGASDRLSLSSHSCSSPNLASGTVSPPRLGRRKSKASLLGLSTKRSLSSLLGRSQSQGHSPQAIVPNLTVEEPEEERESESLLPPRAHTPCPVLDQPVDTSRIELGLGLSLSDETEPSTGAPITLKVPSPSPSPRPHGTEMSRAASDSSAFTNSVFYTPPTTTGELAPANSISVSSSSSSGSYSFLDFSLGRNGEDDWAKSVLEAARH